MKAKTNIKYLEECILLAVARYESGELDMRDLGGELTRLNFHPSFTSAIAHAYPALSAIIEDFGPSLEAEPSEVALQRVLVESARL